MGCAASRLEQEDTVRRCKERRRFMRCAVQARHLLAAAHAEYLRSLRLTASALSRFASGEPLLSVSDHTPPILLPPSSAPSPLPAPTKPSKSAAAARHFEPPSPTIASSKMPHILSESSLSRGGTPAGSMRFDGARGGGGGGRGDGGGGGGFEPPSPTIASSKMPHILSDSSRGETPAGSQRFDAARAIGGRGGGLGFEPPSPTIASSKMPHILSTSSQSRRPSPATSVRKVNNFFAFGATGGGTPSQSSSGWEWEKFYPPSPPDSEYFDRRKAELEEANRRRREQELPEGVEEEYDEEEEEEEEEDQEEVEQRQRSYVGREEIQCRGWDDEHLESSTTSSSKSDAGGDDGFHYRHFGHYGNPRFNGSVAGSGTQSVYSGGGSSDLGWSAPSEATLPQQQPPPLRRQRSMAGSLTSVATAAPEMRLVVRHRTLPEIVAAIEEYFGKAAAAGDGVSDFLEASRTQFDGSLKQLKKTVYHSNSVLSSLSSSWTLKPPLAVRYKLDTSALEEVSGGGKSHSSTLERLLAWEKKLYEEVKARETVKIAHEKKLSTLQSQEYRGIDSAKLDKTKAAIKKLQSLIIVTSQAVATTSTAIVTVRDNELAPQLIELCFALLSMWRSMNQFHEVQNNIIQQVRGLVNRTTGEPTSDLHRLATRDLEAAVAGWHSSFNLLIKYQRDYVHSLYHWLKLTLYQVAHDEHPQGDHGSAISRELTGFCDEWKQALDRLPDTVASEAIKSFVNIIHVIYVQQLEEMKVKKRAEAFSKELERKSGALRSIERKYYQSYSMVGVGLPGNGRETLEGQVFDSRDPLSEKKSELALCRRKVEDEMIRHAKAVEVTRSMTLNNIQTGLPGVFQAMAAFSGMFVDVLEAVCRHAGSVR